MYFQAKINKINLKKQNKYLINWQQKKIKIIYDIKKWLYYWSKLGYIYNENWTLTFQVH